MLPVNLQAPRKVNTLRTVYKPSRLFGVLRTVVSRLGTPSRECTTPIAYASQHSGMGKAANKWYAVAQGRETGVYKSWPECQNQVNGYKGAVFKSFPTRAEAEAFCQGKRGISTNVRAPVFKFKHETQKRAANNSTSVPKGSLEGYEAQMFFDGGSRGNPGPGGCGAALFNCADSSSIALRSAFLGHTTNNRAEYEGLILGLKVALENSIRTISVHGDSKLVVMQVNGKWRAHDAQLANLRDLVVKKLLPRFQRWQVVHVRREGNSEADRLANAALDRAGSIETPSKM